MREGKELEENIEDLQEEISKLENDNEEKQIELLKLTGEV